MEVAPAKLKRNNPLSSQPQMSQSDFARISSRIENQCGIILQDHKRTMVQTRILDRVSALGLNDFGEYLDYLDEFDRDPEQEEFCNALTTNLTSFFRENHHFEHFNKEVEEVQRTGTDRLRIWSAGCSTGEEPYSIAMSLLRMGTNDYVQNTKVLATDIDSKVLQVARSATYDREDLSQFPTEMTGPAVRCDATKLEFVPKIRELISFKRLNLLEPWPMNGPFDFIFCRNVMIYFSAETKAHLISDFAKILRPGGILYLGHSETILGEHPMLVGEGNTIYRRVHYG